MDVTDKGLDLTDNIVQATCLDGYVGWNFFNLSCVMYFSVVKWAILFVVLVGVFDISVGVYFCFSAHICDSLKYFYFP